MSSSLCDSTTVIFDNRSIRESLERLIRNLTKDAALHEDLRQEAMIHLWLTGGRRPGQAPSWYLQSCKFHLQHYLTSGRSVDSAKRRSGQIHFAADSDATDGLPEQGDEGNSVVTSVSARELLSLLAPMLSAQENAVLECLADGLGTREIGRELNISHTMVSKHRRKIAGLLTRLDRPGTAKRIHLNGHRRRYEPSLKRVKSLNTAIGLVEMEMKCQDAA